MKQKSILLVSPGGKSIQSFKIRTAALIAAIVLVIAGFSAYFIPSEKFRLKAAEVRQKQQLSTQNEVLNRRIESATGTLNRLRHQIIDLNQKKERVAELVPAGKVPTAKREGPVAVVPEKMLERAIALESRFNAIGAMMTAAPGNPFDSIPVCKPVDGETVVTRPFGSAKDPFTGNWSEHRGIDFAAAEGTPVRATASAPKPQNPR